MWKKIPIILIVINQVHNLSEENVTSLTLDPDRDYVNKYDGSRNIKHHLCNAEKFADNAGVFLKSRMMFTETYRSAV